MPTPYERMQAKLGGRLQRYADVIQSRVSPVPVRRQETRFAISNFFQEPDAPEYQGQGRDRLVSWAKETYGDASRHILPYLEPQPEGLDPSEGGASGQPFF